MNVLSVPRTPLIKFEVLLNDIPVLCVIDSAAQVSVIDPQLAAFLQLDLTSTTQEIGALSTSAIVRPSSTTTTTVKAMSRAIGSHRTVLFPFFIDLGQNPKYLSQSIKINRDQSRIFSTFNGRPAAPKCAGALKLGKFVHYWT